MDSLRIEGRDPATGDGLALIVRNGLIDHIEPAVVSGNCWLSAGLVDLQVNGFHGLDFNSDSLDIPTVSALTRHMLAVGVTTFAPTLITASQEQLLARLHCIAQARAIDPVAAMCIPFIHVEGPAISSLDGYRGAHPIQHVRPPSLAEFKRWQQSSGGLVGMVTLSPHYDGSPAYISALAASGVRVSIGHTHASPEQMRAAVDAGATLSTHLGNGIAAKLDRHPNPIWSQLAEDRLTASFIADGHHLPAEVLQVMLRAKSLNRSFLVSDSVALAGMPPGSYTQPIGGEVELSPDGRLSMLGASTLAGAALPLIDCIGSAVRLTGHSLADALRLATANPGLIAGEGGTLLPGSRADILQFSWNEHSSIASVLQVWSAGEHIISHLISHTGV